MYKIIYPEKDATIYERFPEKNTGVDQILEIVKNTDGEFLPDQSSQYETWEDTYNSRILIKFDINTISSSISRGKIGINSKYYLSMFCVEGESLNTDYTLYAYPISGSWVNGNGSYYNKPETKNGVSWKFSQGKLSNIIWPTESYSSGVTGSWISYPGGANWYTSSLYLGSQSFSMSEPDIRMDITNMVNGWISGSIVNDGLILKYSESDEQSSTILGSLKFFSKETHTIFIPRLEILWSNESFDGTSSLSEVNTGSKYTCYPTNLKDTYRSGELQKIKLNVRPLYPSRDFGTGSIYNSPSYRLPSASYFSIRDISSGIDLIPFDYFGSKIGCDTNGNYLYLDTESFLPERYYELRIKVESPDEVKYFSDSYYFKIMK